ncbi:20584_t:CDS:2 [Entrophospora sp. SA101]|nr:20584_t:CDS:2 [Entrophospora sp. SA101]
MKTSYGRSKHCDSSKKTVKERNEIFSNLSKAAGLAATISAMKSAIAFFSRSQ